LVVACIRM